MRKLRGRDWLLALVAGVTFVIVMLAAHWWWAEFLLTPNARNNLFGSDRWDYNAKLGPWVYQFWNDGQTTLSLIRGLGIAALTAIVTSRIGLWVGSGMARVQR
jgi:ABC-type spermidine/putrescine transport system permease subunit II